MKQVNALLCCVSLWMTGSVVYADNENVQALYKTSALTPEAALKVVQAAVLSCRKAGYQVTATLVDRGGNVQAVLRDRLAGFSSIKSSRLTARTAANFRNPSATATEFILENKELAGIKHVPGMLFLAGAVPIEASGTTLGAVGVAGAPSGALDEKCARDGVAAIQDLLEFAD